MTVDQARNLLVGLLAGAILAVVIAGYFIQSAHIDAVKRSVAAQQSSVVALEQAAAAQTAVRAVQASRVQACQDTNARHHATVQDLRRDYRAASRHVPRAQRRALRANRRLTIRLINDIVPYRNCRAYVGVRTG